MLFGVNVYPTEPCFIKSLPPPPPPLPWAAAGHLPAFSVPGWVFANFALPGDLAFANPVAISELNTRTRFPIRI